MAVEIELHVPCSRGARHPVRIRLTSWENWEVIDSTCIQTLGRERGANAPCHQILMARNLQIQLLALNALGMVGTSAAPILTSALKGQNVDVRRNACWILGELRAAAAVEALKDALDDYNASVRRVACWALGQIGDPAAVAALVECTRDQDHRIRSAACAALGNIGDPAAVPALKAALADSNVNVRNAAEQALKNITNQGVVDITVECTNGQMHSVSVKVSNWGSWEVIDSTCMQTLGQASGRMALCYHRVMERSLEVRRSVVSALGRKGRSGVSELIGALADSEVRALACQMLGQINDKTAIPALRVHAEVVEEARQASAKLGGTSMALQEAVCTLAEQQHWGVHCHALTSDQVRDAIVQLGSRAVPALIDALRDDDTRIRQAACTALGQIGDPSAVPALIACWDQRDISHAATNALVQIGKPAVPALIEALTSPSYPVRIAACTALGQINDKTAIPALRVHAEVIEEARQSLARLGGTSMALQESVRTLAEQSLWGVLCRALTSDQVRDAIVQLGSRAVPALIDALRDVDPKIRLAACTALGQIGNPAAVSELTKRLQDSVSDVRSAACTALGQIGDPSAVPALIACLNDWFISVAAANALVQIGKPAVPALIEALNSENDFVRRAACTALGQIGDSVAVPKLIQCLKDRYSDVRIAACTALGQIRDIAAIPALRVHAEVMEEARQSLTRLGGTSMALQEAVRMLAEQCQWGVLCRALTNDLVRDAIVQLGSSAVPALIDALRDNDPTIRRAACTALGQIGDTAAVPVLIQRLEDTDSNVRSAACTALGQIRDPSAVPALIACLDQWNISQAAANALVQIGKPAVPALIEALTSPSNPVGIAVCTALGQIGDPSAVPALIACLDQQDISEAAANALVQIGKPAVPALIEALTSPSNRVLIAACTALGKIGDSVAVPKLIQCLKDRYSDVRIAAYTALGKIGDPAAIPALRVHAEIMGEARQALAKFGGTSMALQEAVRMLAEQCQWGVLCRALTSNLVRDAIVQLGSSAVPALIDALRDNDPTIRRSACTTLGQIGNPAAVPVLIQRLEDTDSNVRSAACTALGQIGDAAAIPALRVHAEIMEEAQQELAMLGGTSMALQEAVRTLAEQSQWGVLCRALTSDQVRDTIVQLGSQAVPALIDVLRDDDPEIRRAACTALGQIRDKAPVPSLIEQLKDTNRDVRKAACTALGQIRDSSAVSALISTLNDKDIDV